MDGQGQGPMPGQQGTGWPPGAGQGQEQPAAAQPAAQPAAPGAVPMQPQPPQGWPPQAQTGQVERAAPQAQAPQAPVQQPQAQAVAAAPDGGAQALVDSFGVDARGRLVRLPDAYQPVQIGLVRLQPSSGKGVAEVEFVVNVTDGPFAGCELIRNDSRMYFTLPDVVGAAPEKQGQMAAFARSKLGTWNAFCVTLSGENGQPGQTCDGNALAQFGFQVSGDATRAAAEISAQLSRLDPTTRCEFVRAYCRMELWNGTQCMAYIKLKDEKVQEKNDKGNYVPVMIVDPATGQQVNQTRQRNELFNVYPWTDERYGYASWAKNALPALQQQFEAMRAAGLI